MKDTCWLKQQNQKCIMLWVETLSYRFYSSFQVHSSFQRPVNPEAPFPFLSHIPFPYNGFSDVTTQLFSWQKWGTSLSGRTVLVNPAHQLPECFNYLFLHWESNQWPSIWCCHTVALELRVHIEGALCCPIGVVLLKACPDSWTRLSLRMSITHMSHHLYLTITKGLIMISFSRDIFVSCQTYHFLQSMI